MAGAGAGAGQAPEDYERLFQEGGKDRSIEATMASTLAAALDAWGFREQQDAGRGC